MDLRATRLAIGNIDIEENTEDHQLPLFMTQIFMDRRITYLSFEAHADVRYINENRSFFHE